MNEVPVELAATVDKIRRTYPAAVPDEDYMALVYLLYNEGEMSFRQAARTLAAYFQGDYIDFIPDAEVVSKYESVPPQDITRVRDKLLDHGYAAWLTSE